ncbi:MAG: glycosyltransferase family 4 protein [Gammaproteobacteria bacterium]|nr:glycosyltransferase family 4 protein [Gammaproteobacteria bacterium]
MIVGIDASRCRSGGALRHLCGILSGLGSNPPHIEKIIVWASSSVAPLLPSRPWLVLVRDPWLERGLMSQLFWQAFILRRKLRELGCDVLLTADASSLCLFKPNVVINQDLLAFQPLSEIRKFSLLAQARLLSIRAIQIQALRRAEACIFQSKYGKAQVATFTRRLQNNFVVPHGMHEIKPKNNSRARFVRGLIEKSRVTILYVSPISPYKRQMEVVKAVEYLIRDGRDCKLIFIGAGDSNYADLIARFVKHSSSLADRVCFLGELPHGDVIDFLKSADVKVFASTCESFGITLLEAMSFGIPIACAHSSSLPEVLGDAGEYFDPDSPTDIARAISTVIDDTSRTAARIDLAKRRAKAFTWERASRQTFSIVRAAYENNRLNV